MAKVDFESLKKTNIAIVSLLTCFFMSDSFAQNKTITVTGAGNIPTIYSIDQISTVYDPMADNGVVLEKPPSNEIVEKVDNLKEVVMPPPEKLDEPPVSEPPKIQNKDSVTDESSFFDFFKSEEQKKKEKEAKQKAEAEELAKKRAEEAGKKALYWEQVRAQRRKEREERAKKAEANKKEEEYIIPNRPDSEGGVHLPKRKPKLNYRKYRLPGEINKKVYNKENEHLPSVVYENEYKQLLFDSAALGNLDILRAAVKRFGTTEIIDVQGNNALMYAVMAGNLNSVRSLLNMGAAVDVFNDFGVAPLHMAVMSGRVDMVQLLLRNRASVDIMDVNYMTPLMIAAQKNHVKIAQILKNEGANLSAYTDKGLTALHIAALYNSADVAYYLLLQGVDSETMDKTNKTPLLMAAISGSDDVVNILLKAGANAMIFDNLGNHVTKLAFKMGHVKSAQLIEGAIVKRKLIAQKIEKIRSRRLGDQALDPNPKIRPSLGKDPLPITKPKTPSVKPYFSPEEMKKM